MSQIINRIISDLEKDYLKSIEICPDHQELSDWGRFCKEHDIQGSEGWFVPEEWLYDGILKMINKEDVVFDVGAGDLRLDIQMAAKCRRVYAVEVNPVILAEAMQIIGYDLPANLIPICGNGFQLEVPKDVTVITMLIIHMRHPLPKTWRHLKIIDALSGGVIDNEKVDWEIGR